MKIKYYPLSLVYEKPIKYALMISKLGEKWLYVRHKSRHTWEFPAGKRERKEKIFATAKRELFEETGATSFILRPLYCLGIKNRQKIEEYSLISFVDILSIGPLPNMEIEEIALFDEMPKNLTYPEIQPEIFRKTIDLLNIL